MLNSDNDDDDLKIIQCTQPFLQSFTSVRRWKPLDDTSGLLWWQSHFLFFCCSIFDKQMDPYETFRWYFHTSWLLWWRQFLFWFFVCSTFDNRMETWTVDRSLCWFDHRDWAAYGVARPPGSKQENPAKSNINQLCIIIFILIFLAWHHSLLTSSFCFASVKQWMSSRLSSTNPTWMLKYSLLC